MTLRPIEGTEMLRTKVEPAEQIERAIASLMRGLEEAISAHQPVKICELSRALTDEVDHAFTHPELWGPQRVREVRTLLEHAARETVGTPYEDNCAERPSDLEARLDILLKAREAVQRILLVRKSP